MKRLDKNQGAHFDYKEVIKEMFDIQNELVVASHVNSGTLEDLPKVKESGVEAKHFFNMNDISIPPTDYDSLNCPSISLDKQDTF